MSDNPKSIQATATASARVNPSMIEDWGCLAPSPQSSSLPDKCVLQVNPVGEAEVCPRNESSSGGEAGRGYAAIIESVMVTNRKLSSKYSRDLSRSVHRLTQHTQRKQTRHNKRQLANTGWLSRNYCFGCCFHAGTWRRPTLAIRNTSFVMQRSSTQRLWSGNEPSVSKAQNGAAPPIEVIFGAMTSEWPAKVGGWWGQGEVYWLRPQRVECTTAPREETAIVSQRDCLILRLKIYKRSAALKCR